MKRGMKVFLSWVFQYALSLFCVLLGSYFLNRGNTTAGGIFLVLGVLYFWGLIQYGKKEKKKAVIREAMVEASREMPKPSVSLNKPVAKADRASPLVARDPAGRISKLKELLDKGLIERDEFEKRKADILSEI